MKEHVVAAQMYTVREFCKDLEGVKTSMEKVARIGYTAVQVSGFGDVSASDVGKIAADNGLTIASSHMNWERFMTDLDGIIEEHQIWNCKHPAIGGIFRGYEGAEGVKRFLGDLAPIAEKLATVGMDFSYHNHSHEFAKYDGQRWIDLLLAATTPAQLKMELDVYWVQHGGGDPIAWIKKMRGRMPVVHFKDMIVVMEQSAGAPPTWKQTMAEIGEGNLNWELILPAAHRGGVEYYLVEQDLTYERTPFESLEISYRNLVKMGLR